MLKPNFSNYKQQDYEMLYDCLLSTQGLLNEQCCGNCEQCQYYVCCHDIEQLIDTVSRVIEAKEAVEYYVENVKSRKL